MNMTQPPRNRRYIVIGVLLVAVFVLVPALVVYGVTGFFRLSKDARCLRDSLTSTLESQGARCEETLELSVGTITCHLVRAGSRLAPLEPEVRAVIDAVRGGEVGIYKLGSRLRALDGTGMLAAADKAMSPRGWERLVTVTGGRDLVAVYVSTPEHDANALRACVAVVNKDQIVLASARSNLEPLIELAWKHPALVEASWRARQ